MKVTVDIPDGIYRQVKAKSALEGWSVREVATTLFEEWITKPLEQKGLGKQDGERKTAGDPPWFGALRPDARKAKGRHDMASIRRSIERGRAGETRS